MNFGNIESIKSEWKSKVCWIRDRCDNQWSMVKFMPYITLDISTGVACEWVSQPLKVIYKCVWSQIEIQMHAFVQAVQC